MPTIAIGSSARRTRRGDRPAPAPVARRPALGSRCAASAAGVGWSKTSVAGSRRPVAAAEPVAQLDRGERVEAEVLEGALGVDGRGRRRGRARRRRGVRTRSSSDRARARPRAAAGEPLGERAAAAARRGAAAADQAATGGASSAGGRRRAQRRRGRARRRRAAAVADGERGVEAAPRPSLGGERAMPPRASRARSASAEPAGHPARSAHRPQASECAGRPSARRRCGEGVEEGVGGGVVGLAGAAEDAGDRGEQHERGEVEVARSARAGARRRRPWVRSTRRSRSG